MFEKDPEFYQQLVVVCKKNDWPLRLNLISGTFDSGLTGHNHTPRSYGFVIKITDILEFLSIIKFQVKAVEQFRSDSPLPIFISLEFFLGRFMASSSTKRCVIVMALMTQ